jgi:hypothetical protein
MTAEKNGLHPVRRYLCSQPDRAPETAVDYPYLCRRQSPLVLCNATTVYSLVIRDVLVVRQKLR